MDTPTHGVPSAKTQRVVNDRICDVEIYMNGLHCQICHGDGEHLCGGIPTACPVGGHTKSDLPRRNMKKRDELPFDFDILGEKIIITLPEEWINVTDFLAVMRYMEMNKQLKQIHFKGIGGQWILGVIKDY